MKLLYLHDWQSALDKAIPTYLQDHGHTVLNPALPDDDFDQAVKIAQAEFDSGKPDVVVGSSRGGAVAMNIDAGSVPLVLLCPAWKRWGTAVKVKPGTVILHSRADEIVPFADSEELIRNSGLPSESLIEIGTEHRLADPESLVKMLEVVEKAANGLTPKDARTLLTRVESLKKAAFARITKKATSDGDYEQLCQELIANPFVKDRLPEFVRTCRTLGEFWTFIEQEAETYGGRRRFIKTEFDAVLAFLGQHPAMPDGRYYPKRKTRRKPCPQCMRKGLSYPLSGDRCPRCGYAGGRPKGAKPRPKPRSQTALTRRELRMHCKDTIQDSPHHAVTVFYGALQRFLNGESDEAEMDRVLDDLLHARPNNTPTVQ